MTTLASDNFNRADANPISGNWHEPNFLTSGQLLTNAFAGVNAADPPSDGSYYDDGSTSIPRDCWAECAVVSAAACNGGPKIRGDSNGSGYEYIISTGVISRVSNTGVRTTIATRLSGTINTGDVFRIEATGASPTTIKIYRAVAGTYTQVGADVSDSAGPQIAGFSSLMSGGPTHLFDNFATGNMTGEPPGGGGGGAVVSPHFFRRSRASAA